MKSDLVEAKIKIENGFLWLQTKLSERGNQSYISKKLNISKQYVNQIKKGKKISLDELIRWVDVFEKKEIKKWKI